MARSAIYAGTVRHRRMRDPVHEFTYPIWQVLLDLDEIPDLAGRNPWFSHNRFNLTGFDDCDHMGPTAEPVRGKLERWFDSHGVTPAFASVTLLTQLRLLGHVFNPVSFYFCRDSNNELRHVVAEVNNTFGETYCYLLSADGDRVDHEEDKVFHVSPFQPVDGRYRFRITAPGPKMTSHIDVLRHGEKVFDSTLALERRPLTSAALVKMVLRYPHTGLRTLAMIHLQALRLWIKRAPFFAKPEPPDGAWRTRHG